MNMFKLFKLGEHYGPYCDFLTNDDHRCKTCVAIHRRYVLFEYDNGEAIVLNSSECSGLTRKIVKR